MDKTILKNFAVNSRNKLIEDTIYKLNLLGITKDKIQDPIEANGIQTFQIGNTTFSIFDKDIKKREKIIKEIKFKGFEQFVEEVAYTWFNRIIAIRYMEVNNYLPTKIRVLSSETPGKIEPDIITNAFDIDLDYTQEDKEFIFKLKDENKLDKLFRFLFIKQCNKLNEILPGLFEKTDDYLELLLNISFTSEEDVIRQLIDMIPEADFTKQVEIIGWLYQYYISEKKDRVININKNNIKKEDIPSATQLFTTDWVVKYMVDNSLGRYWIERNPKSLLKDKLDYYMGEAKQDEKTQRKLEKIRSEEINIEDLTFFDPCMGSGHILVYAFEVYFEIYKELGYSERDIPELILKNNLFGLDIDDRAYQLAYFAVLMKARKYDRKILKKGINPNIYSIQESRNINNDVIEFIQKNDSSIVNDIVYLKEIFESGKEFGSLIKVKKLDFNNIKNSLETIILNSKSTLIDMGITNIIKNDLIALINQAEVISKKYPLVATNPPYLNKYTGELREFVYENYKDYAKDLFAAFIYRNSLFCKNNGYCSFMVPMVFMFLSTYENLRKYIINNMNFSSLIQLEYSAFSEATVPLCTFVINNTHLNYNGIYIKLSEFKGGMEVQNKKVLESINSDVNYIYSSKSNKFNKIPGHQIAFWVTQNMLNAFENGKNIENYIDSFQGIITGNNKKFLRYWYEVQLDKIAFNKKSMEEINLNDTYWIPYNKGGKFRKWYGNQEYIINWKNGPNDKTRGKKTFSKYYLREYVSWSYLTSSTLSTRFFPEGFLWDVHGSGMFDKKNNLKYLQALLTSNVGITFLKIINPTINFQVENILQVPIIFDYAQKEYIEKLVNENIILSKKDWDSFESSWNFKKHPLLNFEKKLMHNSFIEWSEHQNEMISKLKQNEIELNKIFIQIYNLENEIDFNIIEKDITIYKPSLINDVKSFISYAVGCMFGRYSLDNEGLQFAGGNFDKNNYHKFIPDDDNIIPVLDTAYFEDDIVGRFVEFVKTCFGEETLEENLDFIANALTKNKKPSREKIRAHLLKNFFNDHKKTYKKCPIYWQFSSGKENGFNCLVYMHRYEPSLLARIRTDYLHKTQKAIEQAISNCDNIINHSSSNGEITKATNDKNKLQKQLKETQEYDEALAHIANQNIEIDLDDGVKVNYAKFQNIEIKKEGSKTRKVNLLKKI